MHKPHSHARLTSTYHLLTAGLNILPQAGGLDDPPGEFAFGDCYLQFKQHMLQRSSFCVGDSGSVVEAALALGVPCELQLATIDTLLFALQNDEFELDDETLCKLVVVLTTGTPSPLPQFEYLIRGTSPQFNYVS